MNPSATARWCGEHYKLPSGSGQRHRTVDVFLSTVNGSAGKYDVINFSS